MCECHLNYAAFHYEVMETRLDAFRAILIYTTNISGEGHLETSSKTMGVPPKKPSVGCIQASHTKTPRASGQCRPNPAANLSLESGSVRSMPTSDVCWDDYQRHVELLNQENMTLEKHAQNVNMTHQQSNLNKLTSNIWHWKNMKTPWKTPCNNPFPAVLNSEQLFGASPLDRRPCQWAARGNFWNCLGRSNGQGQTIWGLKKWRNNMQHMIHMIQKKRDNFIFLILNRVIQS